MVGDGSSKCACSNHNMNRHKLLSQGTHQNVAAGRSSVFRQMASVFLSDKIGLFTNFVRAEDVITTSHSK